MYIYTSFTSIYNTKGNVYNGIAVESSSRANYEFLIQSLEINRSAYRIFARVSRFFDSLAVCNLDKIWHTVARREKVAQGYAELGFSFFFFFFFLSPSNVCLILRYKKKRRGIHNCKCCCLISRPRRPPRASTWSGTCTIQADTRRCVALLLTEHVAPIRKPVFLLCKKRRKKNTRVFP